MKVLIDGVKVSSMGYHFLLNWNENNKRNYIFDIFGKNRLCDLTIAEYKILWKHVTQEEYNILNSAWIKYTAENSAPNKVPCGISLLGPWCVGCEVKNACCLFLAIPKVHDKL